MVNSETPSTAAWEPDAVPHPSVFIQEEMDARGWSRDLVAMRMSPEFGLSRLTLDLYLDVGPRKTNMRIGEKTAKAFARAFDVSPDYFLNLEAAWLKGCNAL